MDQCVPLQGVVKYSSQPGLSVMELWDDSSTTKHVIVQLRVRNCLHYHFEQPQQAVISYHGVRCACVGVVACVVLNRAREELRKRVNMSGWNDKAIIAVVSRLTPQKGVHLIKHAAYKVCWIYGGKGWCRRGNMYAWEQ